jgi:glucosylceramidase
MKNPDIQWISSTEDSYWKEKHSINIENRNAHLIITDVKSQMVEGFGGCFNELSYVALSHLTEEERDKVFYSLFHPEGDHKFSICRLPIGASDYALEWYSLNETDEDYNMENFSIERDRKYLIPYLKEALKYNPNLKLFASPWSPPTWMKSPKAYNYGTLRWEKSILEAYALYFVKFVEAYREEGITVHQIHVQNEVAADQKFPSCLWTGEQLCEFVRDYLGPAFEKHGLDTEIWLGTINGKVEKLFTEYSEDYNSCANAVLSDPDAYKYIKGVGYQWAGKYSIQQTVQSYPELRYMQTENECGDGKNTWRYAQYVHGLFRHYFINGVNSYIYWNMVLEPKGKSTWGWEQNSMITVDPESMKVINNPEFYVMKHFSHYVENGAVRIETKGPWSGNTVAFENPNGSRVAVIANPFNEERDLCLNNNGLFYRFILEPQSFNTIFLK